MCGGACLDGWLHRLQVVCAVAAFPDLLQLFLTTQVDSQVRSESFSD